MSFEWNKKGRVRISSERSETIDPCRDEVQLSCHVRRGLRHNVLEGVLDVEESGLDEHA
jgi:hypothetical protein